MIYKIIVSDRNFNVRQEIQNKASNISWDYNRIGGCGKFSFTLPEKFCQEIALGGNFNIKIERKNPSTRVWETWYQGRIENKNHSVKGQVETMTITGQGYQSQLADIYVDADYSNKTIEYIVDDILDTYVVPNTNITKGTISATGFTADSLEFNTSALDAIQTCANIVGSREWGVDADREFFFKERSSTVGFRFPLKGKVTNFQYGNSAKDIVTRVEIRGGDVAGSPYTETIDNAIAQLKWGRKDKVISNSAIVTTSVANQFANALFAEFGDMVVKANLDLLDEQLIEATIPIPKVIVMTAKVKYGEKPYGTFLYSGNVSYRINSVSYELSGEGVLTINLKLGQLRPNIAENISQLEYKIDQISQQGV